MTVKSTVCPTIGPACCTSPANPPAATCLTMPFVYQEHLTLSAFFVRVASVEAERLTSSPHLRISAMISLSTALFSRHKSTEKGSACIVWFAVSQNARFASLHQARRKQTRPVATSDRREVFRIIFTLMDKLSI